MAYQSKTYSLSDEVITAIEAARKRGLSPNKYLRGLLALEKATDSGEFTTLKTVIARPGFVGNSPPINFTMKRGRGKVTRETRGGKR